MHILRQWLPVNMYKGIHSSNVLLPHNLEDQLINYLAAFELIHYFLCVYKE